MTEPPPPPINTMADPANTMAESDASAADAFWTLQAVAPFWTVPLAHGASMPWLKPFERGLLVAIERSHRLNKTPLLIDTIEDKLVDTYYSYQASIIVEAKKMVLDVATKRQEHAAVMEGLRQQLVNSMKFGQTLYIRLADSACDFVNSFTSDDTFPLAVFDHEAIASLANYREGTPMNLWGSSHPLAKVLRDSDLTQGLFQPRFSHKARSVNDDGEERREGFEVVVATLFKPDDVNEMLREALPLHLLQPIHPQPSTVRLKYSHYNQEFTLDVGGTLRFRTLDERYALSFVFKGAFKVKLKELPKQQAGSNGSSAASRGMARGRDRFRSRPQEPVDGEGGEAASSHILSMDGDGYFHALRGGMSYEVLVEEDEEAEEAAKAAGEDGRPAPRLSAASLAAIQQQQQQSTGARPLAGRNDEGRSNADRLIKEELQNLSVNEIAERSERYRRLREAQDLQDVVFGGG